MLTSLQCRPTGREWPTKCDRCIEEGLECSPGMRKVRKQRKIRRSQDTPAPGNEPDFYELYGAQQQPIQISHASPDLGRVGANTSVEDYSQHTSFHSCLSPSISEDEDILVHYNMTPGQV